MPTDPSTDSATTTDRRTFVARAAVGGALVTAGAMASPIGSLLTFAGAQAPGQATLTDAEFAEFATPLELAAVQIYAAALRTQTLDAAWTERATQFQRHHQAVASTLTPLISDDASAPTPDPDLREEGIATVEGTSDQDGVLLALAQLEETLAATHLSAIALLAGRITAKTVAQVLAVEGQQAALLATAGGTDIAEVTPAEATTDDALPLSGGGPTPTTAPAN